jgi:methylsterol monooxygenase
MAWQMLLNASLLNEVFFFYGHWLFHANKWLYKNVHKVHQEFTSPNAFAAIYCHPFEFLISDIIPMSLGLFLLNAHVYTVMCWIALGIIGTQTHHSGLRFPWALKDHQPKFHDLHHQYFNGNYGNIGLLDWVHGTTISDEFLIRAGELPRPNQTNINDAKDGSDDGDNSTCAPPSSNE